MMLLCHTFDAIEMWFVIHQAIWKFSGSILWSLIGNQMIYKLQFYKKAYLIMNLN